MRTFTLSLLMATAFFHPAIQAQTAPSVPTPAEVLGFEPGQWHARHDQLEAYLRAAAAAAPDRTRFDIIGRTHEQRPLLQLILSSAVNMQRLEQIREAHLAVSRGEKQPDPTLPAIVWLGYSIHGNEASGANASLRVVHQLLTSTDPAVTNLLDNSIILLQPSLNPDGNDRFATWVNMHQGTAPVADPQHREHVEPWPNGRPNHYWFDLNRDWLLLQHPESQARIAQFHRWRPQIVADFHEMGTNSTFFFQPGIPSRNSPFAPESTVKLTNQLAQFHAKALDEVNRLYFTEEAFDDFYVGKGSTYPDVHGSVGILFEQGSSRGHLQQSLQSELSFSFAIDNQYRTSFSTLNGAVAHKQDLQQAQYQFAQKSKEQARLDPVRGYLLREPADQSRLAALLQLLKQHQIAAYALTEDFQINGKTFEAGHSYFVPVEQSQYNLIKAAFNADTNFRDNTFYDVSAWTLPYAYNIDFAASRKTPSELAAEAWAQPAVVAQPFSDGAYAYALSWADQQAPVQTARLLQAGFQLRVAPKAFSAVTAQGIQQFAAGTVLLPAGLQAEGWQQKLATFAAQQPLPLTALTSGLTPQGQDLGSNQVKPLMLPQVLLVAGPGINSTEAGELWFATERLAGVSPSMAEPARLKRLDLARYSHILMPDGNYSSWGDAEVAQLKNWLEQGGVLWAQKAAVSWLAEKNLLQAKLKKASELKALVTMTAPAYQDKEQLAGRQRIAGAIFQTEVDLSHPLTFGLPRAQLPVFKNDLLLMESAEQPFVTVARYSDQTQLAGYAEPALANAFRNSATVLAHNVGDGRIVAMTDNPVFRGYFVGSGRLLVNSLYFGKLFDSGDDSGDGDE